MKGGKLDYQQNIEAGLHVIAIGGLALSRGLTLEGLTVSYILRNTAASDTLMQMARWFGYRPEYEDICRVYLPESSLDHYIYIHEAIEELRTEVRRMQLKRCLVHGPARSSRNHGADEAQAQADGGCERHQGGRQR